MAKRWRFNQTLNITTYGSWSINFSSNGQIWAAIQINNEEPINGMYYGGSTRAYSNNSQTWDNQAYRIVEFETEPTGTLLTFLQANAEVWDHKVITTSTGKVLVSSTGKAIIS